MTATDESMTMEEAIKQQLALAIEPRSSTAPSTSRIPSPLQAAARPPPAYQDLFHNNWVVTRYDDIVSIFQNNDDFDRAEYDPKGDYEFGKKHVFGPNILEYGNSDEHRLPAQRRRRPVRWEPPPDLPPLHRADRARDDGPDLGEVGPTTSPRDSRRAARLSWSASSTTQFPSASSPTCSDSRVRTRTRSCAGTSTFIEGLGFGGEHLARGLQARNEMWTTSTRSSVAPRTLPARISCLASCTPSSAASE